MKQKAYGKLKGEAAVAKTEFNEAEGELEAATNDHATAMTSRASERKTFNSDHEAAGKELELVRNLMKMVEKLMGMRPPMTKCQDFTDTMAFKSKQSMWKAGPGTPPAAKVSNGALELTYNGKQTHFGASYLLKVADLPQSGYYVSARVKADKGGIGIIARYKNEKSFAGAFLWSGKTVYMSTAGKEGNPSFKFAWKYNKWYTLRYEVHAKGMIKILIDGVLQKTHTYKKESELAASAGYVGILHHKGRHVAMVDDFCWGPM